MSFRDNLQHLRAERNMTQEQLAMLLGVSRQSVTKWEAEKSQPEMDKLLKMCEIFDCTLDELVTGDLTGRAAPATAAPIPAGPPTDVCGYDDHWRMMALKVPTGVALILLGIALGLLFEGAVELASWNGRDGIFVIIVLVGILAGLAFLVPAGMEHTAFQKAHPYGPRRRAQTVFGGTYRRHSVHLRRYRLPAHDRADGGKLGALLPHVLHRLGRVVDRARRHAARPYERC